MSRQVVDAQGKPLDVDVVKPAGQLATDAAGEGVVRSAPSAGFE